ncbi:MAG: transposase [Pseudomonadota bacterium]
MDFDNSKIYRNQRQRAASCSGVDVTSSDPEDVWHKGPDVRALLARTACRIHLIQLPPYCPHLNPIERLWAVLHQYVTHNRSYPSQKQFANAILAFMRETIPQEWTKFRDKVSDNFRVINHENFRVLK